MLITEIEPIGDATTELVSEDIIDKIIELPLRKACKIFRNKGIQTIMSSANKNNVLAQDEKPVEKEDVYGTVQKMFESHYFLEAGKGYAWIMLNFNSLSIENKQLLFDLEQTKDEDGNNIGGKRVWFLHPTEMQGNIEYGLRIGKYDVNYLKQVLPENQIPKGIEVDETLVEFEKRHIVLLYPWEETTEAVMLRMPITHDTTVQEVEEYFVKLAEYLIDQNFVKKDVASIK